MKEIRTIRTVTVWITLVAGAMLAGPLLGGPGHDHGEIRVAGPNGGRVLKEVEPHLEFFVDASRHIVLTFLDEAGAATALSGQTATLVGGDRAAPFRMRFAPRGDQALVSDIALPEGMNFPVILRVSTGGDEEAKRVRFNLDLNPCSSCTHAEYACVCAH